MVEFTRIFYDDRDVAIRAFKFAYEKYPNVYVDITYADQLVWIDVKGKRALNYLLKLDKSLKLSCFTHITSKTKIT